MRASLRGHLARAVRGGRVSTLLRAGARAAFARFDRSLPGPLGGPLLATFAVTYRCPLRCAMCDLPARAGDELPDAELPRWIDAIAALRPAGLGFTGGEPLARRATLPALERSVGHGLVTHLNTSGVPVDDRTADRLAAVGLASINVSIDHASPAAHDATRGRDGAFDAALDAVRRLAAARAARGASFRLHVVQAVDRDSLESVAALERTVRAAGADALSLLPVHTFPATPPTAPWPVRPELPSALRDVPLENSRAYLRGIAPFLAGARTPGACSAPRTGLFVDPRGRVFACTPAATTRGAGLAATPETLAAVVRSGRLGETVPEGRCDRCWWNCHRELDVAIGRRPKAASAGARDLLSSRAR